MGSMWDEVLDRTMKLVVMAMALSVIAFFAVLMVAGFFLFLYIKRQFTRMTSIAYAQERWFEGPPIPRWMDAYDYWLYHLENITGLTFTQSPMQLLMGCLIISVGAFSVIGAGLTVLDPAVGTQWLLRCGGLGAGLGLLTGWRMSVPAGNWFSGGAGGGPSLGDSSHDDFGTLIDEEW